MSGKTDVNFMRLLLGSAVIALTPELSYREECRLNCVYHGLLLILRGREACNGS